GPAVRAYGRTLGDQHADPRENGDPHRPDSIARRRLLRPDGQPLRSTAGAGQGWSGAPVRGRGPAHAGPAAVNREPAGPGYATAEGPERARARVAAHPSETGCRRYPGGPYA